MPKKKFRFENAWLLEPLCAQIVKDNWEVDRNHNILQKIGLCGESLEVWGKEITGCFNRRIRNCKIRLQQLRRATDAQSTKLYKEAKEELFLILDQKEIFWRQRSKQLWLQSGDKNTRYFHASCNIRRRTNHIQKLKDSNDRWVDWQTGLQQLIISYYEDLFAATATDNAELIACVNETVSQAQNRELLREVSAEEVKAALFQMNPDKAPGPDGMTPVFFRSIGV